MCPPEHYAVAYAINPWMDTAVPVDIELAVKQWDRLRETLAGLGPHRPRPPPEPGLPDMVFAANGAFSVDGAVYGARFRYPQRTAEAAAHRACYERGRLAVRRPGRDQRGRGRLRLRARGVRRPDPRPGTASAPTPAAHAEAQEVLAARSFRCVWSTRASTTSTWRWPCSTTSDVAYYPAAFSPRRRGSCEQLFPDAVIADEADALAFGLNLVSDGGTWCSPPRRPGWPHKLAAAGYLPVPVELAELKKGGGSVKCCVAELRAPAATKA